LSWRCRSTTGNLPQLNSAEAQPIVARLAAWRLARRRPPAYWRSETRRTGGLPLACGPEGIQVEQWGSGPPASFVRCLPAAMSAATAQLGVLGAPTGGGFGWHRV